LNHFTSSTDAELSATPKNSHTAPICANHRSPVAVFFTFSSSFLQSSASSGARDWQKGIPHERSRHLFVLALMVFLTTMNGQRVGGPPYMEMKGHAGNLLRAALLK
jgi:hypothetical protein